MNNDQDKSELSDEQEGQVKAEPSRRDFLRVGGMGLAGLAGAAALGVQPSKVYAQTGGSGKRRVTILFDSWNHMMPAPCLLPAGSHGARAQPYLSFLLV